MMHQTILPMQHLFTPYQAVRDLEPVILFPALARRDCQERIRIRIVRHAAGIPVEPDGTAKALRENSEQEHLRQRAGNLK